MTNLPHSARRRLEAQVSGDHPDAGLLTAFVEQGLNAAERASVLAHLASCAACREVVALTIPEAAPAEEVNPLAPSWFRWPLLRWAAVAATAVIVWAAVSVVVPRTSRRDASVEVSPNAKQAEESTAAAPEPQVAVVPPPQRSPQMAKGSGSDKVRANLPAATLNSPRKEMIARDQALSKTDALDRYAATAQIRSRAESVANMTKSAAPPPPPPAPAAASPEKKAMQAAGYSGAVRDAAPVAKQQTTTAEFAPKPATVGETVAKDISNALIAGKVTDATGAVVPNALVKITNARTNTSTALHTDSEGEYRAPVAPGLYSVEAGSPGMQTVKVTGVTVAGNVAQNITLNPAAAMETVEVSAAQGEMAAPVPAAPPQGDRGVAKAGKGQGAAVGGALASKSVYKPWLPLRWRVTSDGRLEQSSDGTSWAKAATAPSAVFRAVSAFGLNVWAGGERGALFHSSDDGRTWTRIPVGGKDSPVSGTITAISVTDANSVLVTTSSGERWSSKDAGATWVPLRAQH